MNSVLDGALKKAVIGKMHRMMHVCKRTFENFEREGHNGFLGNISLTLVDKADGKDLKRRENHWMREFKIYSSFGLYIEDTVGLIPCESLNFTGGLNVLIFFGILVRELRIQGKLFWTWWINFLHFSHCLFLY